MGHLHLQRRQYPSKEDNNNDTNTLLIELLGEFAGKVVFVLFLQYQLILAYTQQQGNAHFLTNSPLHHYIPFRASSCPLPRPSLHSKTSKADKRKQIRT